MLRWKNRVSASLPKTYPFRRAGTFGRAAEFAKRLHPFTIHVRIKKIDDLRQTAREPVFESIERGERGRFACSASRDDFGGP